MLRQLARIGDSPVGMVRTWRVNSLTGGTALDGLKATLAFFRKHKLAQSIEMILPPTSPPTGTLEDSIAAFCAMATKAGLSLNLSWPGGDPARLGQLVSSVPLRAIFCPAELSPEERSILVNSASLAVFSPCKELLEERDISAVRQLVDEGGAIALASGYDSRDAPIFSMQMVVALGVLRLRLTVEQAITATTINAAHALGRSDEIGSLEVGKRADLLVLNLSNYREIPRRFGLNHVGMAIRDGNLVLNRNRAKASGV
jgi:imidazolonepropionase